MQIRGNITASRNCVLQQFCDFLFLMTRRLKNNIGIYGFRYPHFRRIPSLLVMCYFLCATSGSFVEIVNIPQSCFQSGNLFHTKYLRVGGLGSKGPGLFDLYCYRLALYVFNDYSVIETHVRQCQSQSLTRGTIHTDKGPVLCNLTTIRSFQSWVEFAIYLKFFGLFFPYLGSGFHYKCLLY